MKAQSALDGAEAAPLHHIFLPAAAQVPSEEHHDHTALLVEDSSSQLTAQAEQPSSEEERDREDFLAAVRVHAPQMYDSRDRVTAAEVAAWKEATASTTSPFVQMTSAGRGTDNADLRDAKYFGNVVRSLCEDHDARRRSSFAEDRPGEFRCEYQFRGRDIDIVLNEVDFALYMLGRLDSDARAVRGEAIRVGTYDKSVRLPRRRFSTSFEYTAPPPAWFESLVSDGLYRTHGKKLNFFDHARKLRGSLSREEEWKIYQEMEANVYAETRVIQIEMGWWSS